MPQEGTQLAEKQRLFEECSTKEEDERKKREADEIEEERKRGTHEHPNEFKPDNSAHDTSTNE